MAKLLTKLSSKSGTSSAAAPKKGLQSIGSLVKAEKNQQAEIERLAYQFFVERGYQHGYDREDWVRAETIVRGRGKS